MANEVSVKLSGPVFSGVSKEIAAKAAEDVIRTLTEDGMNWLAKDLPASYQHSRTGNNLRQIAPVIQGPIGRITNNNATYGAWIEGTSSRNETTRFKGYSNFRRATQTLNDMASDVCAKKAEQLAKDLGG